MFALVFAAVVFLFLLVGSVAFVICALIPAARRYALSAALWCAFWGLCVDALIVVAGTALMADVVLTRGNGASSFPLPTGVGWTFILLGLALSLIACTAVAWIHQLLIHRMTFPLFRIYATAVSAGIGSVFGWVLGWWLASQHLPVPGLVLLWGFAMPLLVISFGWSAFKGARALRSDAPTKFTWITHEEFEGI